MVKRLAGHLRIATLVAVVTSLFDRVDIATKAMADQLQRQRPVGPLRFTGWQLAGLAAMAVAYGLGWLDALSASGIALGVVATPVGRDAHHDVPLQNIAVAAFQGTEDFVGPRLFPAVPVGKQADKYYIIDPDSWLRIPNTRRAPKTRPNRIEWKVSSDAYFADNYALAGELAKEDLANADAALMLRENTTRLVTQALLRDQEVRIVNLVTSISNVGSGVTLAGTAKWSDFVSSDPIADVTTAHAFVRQKTGLVPNTLVLDEDTYQIVRRHPLLLDMYKYTSGGMLDDAQLAATFRVRNIWRALGVKNNAVEGAAASITNIWGNNVLLALIQPGQSPQTQTLGLGFRWEPDGIPAAMQVFRYDDPDPGKKTEIVEVGYYQDERVIAKDLGYLIKDTL